MTPMYLCLVTHPDGRLGAVIAPNTRIAQQALARDQRDPEWLTASVQIRNIAGDTTVLVVQNKTSRSSSRKSSSYAYTRSTT